MRTVSGQSTSARHVAIVIDIPFVFRHNMVQSSFIAANATGIVCSDLKKS